MTDDIIFKIKTQDISSIISRYTKLIKASGDKMKGCCPFHKENTPSFYVDLKKNFYKCFGCGVGGDIITFISKIENLDFMQSVDMLCNIFNIKKEERNIKLESNITKTKNIILYEINEKILSFFEQELKKNQNAINYLKEKRQMSDDIIKRSRLGFCPRNEIFMKFIKDNNISIQNLETLGILRKNKDDHYLFFQNRLMIPIFNYKNQIIGFGGRILVETKEIAKYINSTDSIIFHKRENFYNIENVYKKNFKNLILVEGYFDVIKSRQRGIENILGSLGTAISEEQIKLLLNLNKNLIISLDNDNSGRAAMYLFAKNILKFMNSKIDVHFYLLRDVKDFDTFLENNSKEDLLNDIERNKIDLNEYLFNALITKFNIKNVKERIFFEEEIKNILQEIKDDSIKTAYSYYFKSKVYDFIYKKRENKEIKNLEISTKIKVKIEELIDLKNFFNYEIVERISIELGGIIDSHLLLDKKDDSVDNLNHQNLIHKLIDDIIFLKSINNKQISTIEKRLIKKNFLMNKINNDGE